MEARSCNFRTDSYIFRKRKFMDAHMSNLPPNFPQMEYYQCQITAQNQSKVARKVALHGKNCTVAENSKVAQKLCSATRNFLVGPRTMFMDLWFCYHGKSSCNECRTSSQLVQYIHHCHFLLY